MGKPKVAIRIGDSPALLPSNRLLAEEEPGDLFHWERHVITLLNYIRRYVPAREDVLAVFSEYEQVAWLRTPGRRALLLPDPAQSFAWFLTCSVHQS